MEDDSVAEAGVEVKEETIRDHVSIHSVRVVEAVAHSVVDGVQDAAPQTLIHYRLSFLQIELGLLDGVPEGEGVVPNALHHLYK